MKLTGMDESEKMNDSLLKLILLANVAATLYLVGLIWFVQLVHYPLFGHVGPNVFSAYETAHSIRTTIAVGPPMLIEALTTALLLLYRPANISFISALIGAVLLAVIWFSTWFLQVPQHTILASGFDPEAHHFLVVSNWLRTFAWSGRGGFVLSILPVKPPNSFVGR